VLEYKSAVDDLSELISTQQSDFLSQLIEAEEQQSQNETIVLMSIIGAIALGIVVAAARRGSDV
jgi:Mg2+ and Co2+ transporter CorA